MKRFALVLLVLVFGGGDLFSQGTGTPTTGTPAATTPPGQTATPAPTVPLPVPKPYGADEFPPWAEDLRRFDVISIGSWPISFLFSSLAFDLGRWVGLSISGDNRATQYAPLFFAPANKPANTLEETQTIIWISVGMSLTIGLTDYLIGQAKRQEEEARQGRLRRELLENSLLREEAPSPQPGPENGEAIDSDSTVVQP